MVDKLHVHQSKDQGKLYVVADRWFPSTQLCSVCGYRNKKTKNLSLRKWKCPKCKTKHDRDQNAGQNQVGAAGWRQSDVTTHLPPNGAVGANEEEFWMQQLA